MYEDNDCFGNIFLLNLLKIYMIF